MSNRTSHSIKFHAVAIASGAVAALLGAFGPVAVAAAADAINDTNPAVTQVAPALAITTAEAPALATCGQ